MTSKASSSALPVMSVWPSAIGAAACVLLGLLVPWETLMGSRAHVPTMSTVFPWVMAASALFWGIVQRYHPLLSLVASEETLRRLPRNDQLEFLNRHSSTVHAVFTTITMAVSLAREFSLFDIPAVIFTHAPFGEIGVAICVGYFLFDLATILYYRPLFSWGTVAHHVTGLTIFPMTFAYRHCEVIIVLFVWTEITTPAVNLRWMLTKIGLRKSKGFAANGLYMFFGFFFFRVLMTPYVLYMMHFGSPSSIWSEIHPAVVFGYFFAFSTISFLNYYWFFYIAKGAFKLVKALIKGEDIAAHEEVDGVTRTLEKSAYNNNNKSETRTKSE